MKLFGLSTRAAILVVLAPTLGALGACKFDPPSGSPTDGAPGVDANPDAEPDANIPPDAAVCFGTGITGPVCLSSPPAAPLSLNGTIDTTACGDGAFMTIEGVETCVLAGTTITVSNGSAVQGIGARPLVLVASDAITIEGRLSVGSRRGQPPGAGASTAAASTALCAVQAPIDLAEDDDAGAGGGAGASFLGNGGDGGVGDNNNNGGTPGTADGAKHVAAVAKPTVIRAGCRGTNGGTGVNNMGAGIGGMGGGALYLIAGTRITISDIVTAHGAGGGAGSVRGGAGGGGSGGMIGLDAPTVTISGGVTANGGGGGEGGVVGDNSASGSDGAADGSRAAGGSGTLQAGNGGLSSGRNGGGNDIQNGDAGSDDTGGGGGGGGGAGYIYVKGTLSQSGTISPVADDQ